MTERDADMALRDLFKEAGDLSAPEGLDMRILQRIALMPKPAIVPDKPLLPKWTWLIAAVLVVGLILSPGIGALPEGMWRLPSFHWDMALPFPWMFMGLGACMGLLALDAWLNKRRWSHWSRGIR